MDTKKLILSFEIGLAKMWLSLRSSVVQYFFIRIFPMLSLPF
jgi:hypothetical protein